MLDALTLDQMRVFAAVAETGSFSAAARRLDRVQSAISQSVKTMEATLDIRLFERDGKAPEITAEGQALLRQALDILGDVDAFKRRAEVYASGYAPRLSLAVDQVLPLGLLNDGLESFRTKYPMIPVTLFTEGLGATEERLRSKVADLAIYSPSQAPTPDLEFEFLAKVKIVPIVAADHELASIDGLIGHAELRRHVQLVLTDRAQSVQSVVLSHNFWRYADQHSRMEHILKGFGWSFAPLHLVKQSLADGRLRILRLAMFGGNLLSLPLYCVFIRGRKEDPAMIWFSDYLRGRLGAYRDAFVQPEDDAVFVSYPWGVGLGE